MERASGAKCHVRPRSTCIYVAHCINACLFSHCMPSPISCPTSPRPLYYSSQFTACTWIRVVSTANIVCCEAAGTFSSTAVSHAASLIADVRLWCLIYRQCYTLTSRLGYSFPMIGITCTARYDSPLYCGLMASLGRLTARQGAVFVGRSTRQVQGPAPRTGVIRTVGRYRGRQRIQPLHAQPCSFLQLSPHTRTRRGGGRFVSPLVPLARHVTHSTHYDSIS